MSIATECATMSDIRGGGRSLSFKKEVEVVKNKVLQYVEESLDGTIPQGQKMIWAMERFLNDLEKTEQEDFPYYMDWEELFRFNTWASMFKHRKGTLAGQNIELVPYQLFLAGNIFGFKHKDSGYRKHKEVYIQVGRKNAKDLAF